MKSKEKALRKPLKDAQCKQVLAAVCPEQFGGGSWSWKRVTKVTGGNGSLVRIFSLEGHPILGSVTEENERITIHLKAIEPEAKVRKQSKF